MERLTGKRNGQNVVPLRQNGKIKWAICYAGLGDASTKYLYGDHVDRLAAIEDILGDEYELDRLKELVEADKEGRCVVLPIKVPGWGWCCNREYPNPISAYFAYPSQVVDCMEKYILKESKDKAQAAEELKQAAIRAACEAVQVAAMAEKMEAVE